MRDRINKWAELPFYNPTNILLSAQQEGFRHRLGSRPQLPASMRGAERKSLIECLDASIFAHGIGQILPGRDVAIAEFEAQDHDFVIRFGPPDNPGYCPLQLKTLVSEDVNPSQTVQQLLDGLIRYVDSCDLVVAIKIDRPKVDIANVKMPTLRIGEVWFFGACSDVEDHWYLYGDCLGTPQRVEFDMPLPPR